MSLCASAPPRRKFSELRQSMDELRFDVQVQYGSVPGVTCASRSHLKDL